MNQLKPADFLIGPAEGWTYYRGHWSAVYEGIRSVERQRGPFALWTGERLADGLIEAKVVLDRASEFGSLLFRAQAEGDEQRGYEVTLDPRRQRLILRRHGTNETILADAECAIPVLKPISLKIELNGAHIGVWLDGSRQTTIDAVDPSPISAKGFVGLRAWGASMSLDQLALSAEGKTLGPVLDTTDPTVNSRAANHRALNSFCLLLLNLNEMIYVD